MTTLERLRDAAEQADAAWGERCARAEPRIVDADYWEYMLRALLQELREPDEAMLIAANEVLDRCVFGHRERVAAKAAWQAGIGAILSDTPTPAEGRW